MDRARDDAERGFGVERGAQGSVVDARREHHLPELEGLRALGEQTGELFVAGEMWPVVVQDPDLGTVGRAEPHDATDHRFELLRAGSAAGDHGVLFREELLVERPDDEVEDLRLRTEVRIEAPRQHPARVGDVTCRRVGVSLLGDQSLRDAQDLFAASAHRLPLSALRAGPLRPRLVASRDTRLAGTRLRLPLAPLSASGSAMRLSRTGPFAVTCTVSLPR